MPEFSFGKAKEAVEKQQTQLDNKGDGPPPMKVGDMADINAMPNSVNMNPVVPVDSVRGKPFDPIQPVEGEKQTDVGVQGIGPSAVAGGTMLEPKAPTGTPQIVTGDPLANLTAEERELLNDFRAKRGLSPMFAETHTPVNPRIAGASDVFSPQSDKARMKSLPVEVLSGSKEMFPSLSTGAVAESGDPDFIPGVPFVGQQRQPGEKKFSVQLTNQTLEYVFARDRLEAVYRYNLRLGIISTIHQHTVMMVE